MQLEILSSSGAALRRIHHAGQDYVEAPAAGEYSIRLTNTSPHRRLAVLTVDGRNVCDGQVGSYGGAGFVLAPWQSTVIKGYLRGSAECARFTFVEAGSSYAAQVGDGVKNTSIIGVGVFDEAPAPPSFVPPPVYRGPSLGAVRRSAHYMNESSLGSFMCDADDTLGGETRCRSVTNTSTTDRTRGAMNLGTGYGRAETFYTSTTTFRRATTAPSMIVTLRYGVTDKLREWGVPVDVSAVIAPEAFPASPGYAQPPAGWVR